MDPFFEQLVRNSKEWQLQTEVGVLPKITRYEPGISGEFQMEEMMDGSLTKAKLITPVTGIQAILDSFIFDYGHVPEQMRDDSRPDIPVSCPTSNCTWEPYESLGICSDCTDIADMLEFGCHRAPFDWVQNATSFVPYENGTMCGWFFNATSTKPMLMMGYQVDNDTNYSGGEILVSRVLPLITNMNRRRIFNGSINYQHVRNPLQNIVIVSPKDGPDDEQLRDSIFRNERPRALECVLSWCVKTFKSSYYAGTYTETVTDTFTNTTAGPFPWTQVKVVPPPKAMPDAVIYYYFQNVTIDPHAVNGQSNTSSYGVSNETAWAVINNFDDYFPQFTTYENSSSTSPLLAKYHTTAEQPYHRQYASNPWLAPNNVTEYIDVLATYLTNFLRESSTENVTGAAYEIELFVQVSWPWLILPLCILVLTFVFLMATILRTLVEKDEVGIWKTSAIAALRYGLPEKIQQKIQASQADGTLSSKANAMNIKMSPKRGWRISRHPFTPDLRRSLRPTSKPAPPPPPPGFF
jgi:hypothetical protein